MARTGAVLEAGLYLGVSTHVVELPGAELEGLQQALDILLRQSGHTQTVTPNYTEPLNNRRTDYFKVVDLLC